MVTGAENIAEVRGFVDDGTGYMVSTCCIV